MVTETQSRAKDALVEQLSKGAIKSGDDIASVQQLLSHKLELEQNLQQKDSELRSLEAEVTSVRRLLASAQVKEEESAKRADEAVAKVDKQILLFKEATEEVVELHTINDASKATLTVLTLLLLLLLLLLLVHCCIYLFVLPLPNIDLVCE